MILFEWAPPPKPFRHGIWKVTVRSWEIWS